MLRMGLLTSTAMTAVTLLLSGVSGAYAQTNMHVTSQDPNTRFLCTYGQFAVFAGSLTVNSSYDSNWMHVAVPVTGLGQTVTTIKVIEARTGSTTTPFFSAGIYADTGSGPAERPLAIGTGKARRTCGPVSISIPQTKLLSKTTYWIEETIPVPGRCWERHNCEKGTELYWQADPNKKSMAYVQRHDWGISGSHFPSGSSSYTTPWTKQASGPYLTLK